MRRSGPHSIDRTVGKCQVGGRYLKYRPPLASQEKRPGAFTPRLAGAAPCSAAQASLSSVPSVVDTLGRCHAMPVHLRHTAMVITNRHIDSPTFATPEEPAWRMAPSPTASRTRPTTTAGSTPSRTPTTSRRGNAKRRPAASSLARWSRAPRLAYEDRLKARPLSSRCRSWTRRTGAGRRRTWAPPRRAWA